MRTARQALIVAHRIVLGVPGPVFGTGIRSPASSSVLCSKCTTPRLGGRNKVLGEAIASPLREADFHVARATGDLAGQDRSNICNRGSLGGGVQLDLAAFATSSCRTQFEWRRSAMRSEARCEW